MNKSTLLRMAVKRNHAMPLAITEQLIRSAYPDVYGLRALDEYLAGWGIDTPAFLAKRIARMEAELPVQGEALREIEVSPETTHSLESVELAVTKPVLRAIQAGIARNKYPGNWVHWKPEQPVHKFLLDQMMVRGTWETNPNGGRGRFTEPYMDCLKAIPFIYQGASEYLMARQLVALLGISGDFDGIGRSRLLHDALGGVREGIAASTKRRLDGDFAEATILIEQPHFEDWQDLDNEAVSSVDGADNPKIRVGCDLEEAYDAFADRIGEGDVSARLSVTAAALDIVPLWNIQWDSWVEIALRRISVKDQEGKPRREKVKARYAKAGGWEAFHSVNAVYRALVKEQWAMEALIDMLDGRLGRVGKVDAGHREPYGGEPEEFNFGRKVSYLGQIESIGGEWDYTGPLHTLIAEVEAELFDLKELLLTLEAEQKRLTAIWRLWGLAGVPKWYNKEGEAFFVGQEALIDKLRKEQRDEWLATRAAQHLKEIDPKVLAYMEALSNTLIDA